MENLARLISEADDLIIYDNSSAATPYRVLASFHGVDLVEISATLPTWVEFLARTSHAVSSRGAGIADSTKADAEIDAAAGFDTLLKSISRTTPVE